MTPAAAVALIPTVAFVLHDFVFQLPDNQHEASVGFFTTIIGLLAVWFASGYLAAPDSKRPSRRGALAGLSSVIALWFAFIALNRLAPDRMSYEPDRIRAFRSSGYPTMREYVRQAPIGAGPFPLLLGAAVVMGSAGGLVAGRRRRQTDR